MTDSHYDIAIVGGGMVGLSFALLLADALVGRKIAVIDRQPLVSEKKKTFFQPGFDARTTALAPSSIEIFQHLGVWTAISEHATPIAKVMVSDSGFPGRAAYSREDNAGEMLGYVVENAWLGRQLLAHSRENASIALFDRAETQGLAIAQQAAYLTLVQNGGREQRIAARLVVIADGANSSLREQLGIGVKLHDYQQSAIIASVGFDWPHQCVAYERFTEAGPLALLPLGESCAAKTSALVWTNSHQEALRLMDCEPSRFLQSLQRAFGHRLGRFNQVSERHSYPLQRIIAKEQHRARVVLAGNAAHYLHPVAGQGFNLALRDGAVLAETLANAQRCREDIGAPGCLRRYVEQQHRDQAVTAGMSHGFNRLFTHPHPLARASRNLALFGLGTLPGAGKLFFEQMMGQGILHRSAGR